MPRSASAAWRLVLVEALLFGPSSCLANALVDMPAFSALALNWPWLLAKALDIHFLDFAIVKSFAGPQRAVGCPLRAGIQSPLQGILPRDRKDRASTTRRLKNEAR